MSRVFGIANFSYAARAPHDFEQLAAAILEAMGPRQTESFRVSVRRTDKRFPLTSPQIEREVGGLIKQATGWRVDLEHPALEIHIEMLPEHAFFFFGKEPGAGGLPTGSSGRLACLLSGGIDSPVAAYRMMRRGCSVLFIHFHSYPILSRASQEKVHEIVRLLTMSQLQSQLMLVPFGELQQQVLLNCPAELRVVIYRRLMLRIAERLAHRMAGPRARHRRGGRTGRLADPREPDQHRPGDDARGAAAAGRDGQGRNRRRGGAHRHAADFQHSGPGLLHAVHAPPSGHAVADRAGARGRGRAADRHNGRAARSPASVVEDFKIPRC